MYTVKCHGKFATKFWLIFVVVTLMHHRYIDTILIGILLDTSTSRDPQAMSTSFKTLLSTLQLGYVTSEEQLVGTNVPLL